MRLAWLILLIPIVASAQADQYNPIYRGEAGEVFARRPNQLLVDAVRNRKPGSALDVGMGQGRNAIFLAQQGWDVTGFDVADEGVRQAAEEARRQGLRLRTEVTSFEKFDFGVDRWDLIVLTYEPTKAIAPHIERALRTGGLVVVEDRHLDTRRVWPAGTFSNNELINLFPGLRVLKYEDVWARPDWSAHQLAERLVRLVAESLCHRYQVVVGTDVRRLKDRLCVGVRSNFTARMMGGSSAAGSVHNSQALDQHCAPWAYRWNGNGLQSKWP